MLGARKNLRKETGLDVYVCIYMYMCTYMYMYWARGGVVIKALRYKPKGRGFDSRWCHWNFSVT